MTKEERLGLLEENKIHTEEDLFKLFAFNEYEKEICKAYYDNRCDILQKASYRDGKRDLRIEIKSLLGIDE